MMDADSSINENPENPPSLDEVRETVAIIQFGKAACIFMTAKMLKL